ncbi:uncharacterized protein N7477_007382 [Penicillium maclennaniae]|uniref:uncharacterized protein n=1 Tax=Penicillium maclennaniae TaxID=1343394 RepID=UPI002540C104|nr:uncharacterized protein N7477_007382 [Penicillium maclennaniae]KAJ5664934.1 hypothetical protein N7477_007382 [Penicillium maclennaniae]
MSGLEAIGAAASILQVADLGARLSVKLFSFYRRVQDAHNTIQVLSNEVALVSAILRELGDNLEEEESSKLCSDEAFRTLSLVLTQCRDILEQIQRMVDIDEQPEKSQLRRVTGKLRIVLLEPSWERLKINLERLKSTMLLLLNVIMYAGQIRSNNIPTMVQEQRDLIQTLLEERQNENPKPRQSSIAEHFSPGLTTVKPRGGLSHTEISGIGNQKLRPANHRSNSSDQAVQSSIEHTNNRGARKRYHRAMEDNKSAELENYNTLIQSMLDGIESCKRNLEKNRHSRIRTGVLNIHSGEIMRFQVELGSPIHIDHSLFAEHISGNPPMTKVTGPSTAPTESLVDMDYNESDESDLSETDLSIRRQNKSTASVDSCEASPNNRDYELLMSRRIIERDGHQNMLERNDVRQDLELWRQQQEIERLERALQRDRERRSSSHLAREEKEWDENNEETSCRLRKLDTMPKYAKDCNAAEHWSQSENFKEVDAEFPQKGQWKTKLAAEKLNLAKTQEAITQSEESKAPISASDMQRASEEDGKEEEEGAEEVEPGLDNAAVIESKQDQDVFEQESERPQPSSTEKASNKSGNDAQSNTLTLPDNMEDLLARWTTLKTQEIQRGPFSGF